jgi:HAD superfamily hydrolase (TIGR01549 family)
VYKAVLSQFAPDQQTYDAVLSEFRSWLAPRQEELNPLREGVHDGLEKLSSKYRLALAANQGAYIHDLLARHGLRHYFSASMISGDVGLSKPDPEFFQRMLYDTGCSVKHAVMVGDSLTNDLIPAHRMGFRTVRVLAGGDNVRDDQAFEFVSGTVTGLAELPRLLTSWTSGANPAKSLLRG